MMRTIAVDTVVISEDLSLPKVKDRGSFLKNSLDAVHSSAPAKEPEVPDTPNEPLPEWEPDETPRIEPDPEDSPIPHPSPAPQPGTEPVPDRIPTFCPWRRSE